MNKTMCRDNLSVVNVTGCFRRLSEIMYALCLSGTVAKPPNPPLHFSTVFMGGASGQAGQAMA